ncbi:MAG: undecaprenyl/decaprenyl-phosphate alpha-N-acetylglucosaminyl 1-phosphate transferase, partial [Acidimicrobiia bacterium]|nr:undecaprenyl/decaprenyl-phosphate alpha-N-acetylglucosaminyl 1-phosphate transferase [Acidimicrobiia bacterium]
HTALAMLDRYDVGLAFASGIVLLLGLADDKLDLEPKIRLVVEVGAAVVLVTQADVGVRGWWGLLVGTLLVVVAINAVNLFDGLDGLVASTAIVAALGIAWLSEARGYDGSFGLVLAAAVLGFLVLNWNPARVFLGDNGAYTVAVLLAYGILRAHAGLPDDNRQIEQGGAQGPMVDVAVWIAMGLLGVFVLDLAVTFIRRKLNDRPLFEGDRSHVYDQLRDRGIDVKQVALRAVLLQGLIVVIVVAADRWIGGLGAVLLLLAVVAALLIIARQAGFLRVDAQ